jgi:hypothetical protein
VHNISAVLVYLIPAVDIDTFEELLVTDLQVTSTASVAEFAKARTQVQGIVFLQKAGIDLFLLRDQS